MFNIDPYLVGFIGILLAAVAIMAIHIELAKKLVEVGANL